MTQNCYILELKDGHEFDTKSSAKEQANLRTFLSNNAMALRYFQSYCKICCFNAESKEQIRSGFKNKIAVSQAMTGRELCEILPLDYNAIIESRANDREDNFNQFLGNLTQIEPVMNWIKANK